MTDDPTATPASYGLSRERPVAPPGIGTVRSGVDGVRGTAGRCDQARVHRRPGRRDRGPRAREAAGHVEPGTPGCRLASGDFPFTAAVPPPQEKP